MAKVFVIFFALICLSQCQNNRPIIGILTEELTDHSKSMYNNAYTSYIAASYVKFIEGAGARVVPIWIGKSDEYYRRILSRINGVLLPGGSASFDTSGGFTEAGGIIYGIAKEMNAVGDYFPILGICLGFELLIYIAANNTKNRRQCDINREALPLIFKDGYELSKLFGNASNDTIQILKTKNVTVNLHKYCITEHSLNAHGVAREFRVTSYNMDNNGLQFISSLEHKQYPFYGLQFHPEKNLYEWKLNLKIPHSFNAVQVGQYFANFFVNEARKSEHTFPNSEMEKRKLIYNYSPTYTGLNNTSFEQCYLF